MDSIVSRFALADPAGRLIALVADGLPEWPTDLTDATAVPDARLAELETAFMAEFERLAETPDAADADLQALADHVRDLRDEAARRMSATEPEGGEGAPEGDAPAEDDPPAAPEGDPPAPDGGDGDDAALAARADRIAAMRAAMTTVAPDPNPGVTREDLVAATRTAAEAAAGVAATAAVQAVMAAIAVREQPPAGARGGRVTAADLGGYRPDGLAPNADSAARTPRLNARLLTSADIPNLPMGQEITSMDQLRDAFVNRLGSIGSSSGVTDEKVPVATMSVEVPSDRDLRGMDWAAAKAKVRELIGDSPLRADSDAIGKALTASGGIAALEQPYYGQMVIANSVRPFRDALPTFAADRGGIRLILPPSIGTVTGVATPGQYADGVTNTDTSLVSATAAFTAADVGSYVSGAGIVNGTRILSRTNATTVVLDTATTATATGVTFRISGRNPNNLGAPVGLVTASQDATGSPTTVKMTYDVPVGTPVTFDVYSIYTSLQFANLTSRTNPEIVEAYIRVVDALHARVAETQMMDFVTLWSTLFTGAKTFGTARQLLAQLGHMAAAYRNIERMDDKAVLRCGLPAWSINAMRADYLSSFIGGGAANWGLSDDEIIGFFAEHHLLPFFFLDGPTDVSQLFATSALAAATGNGVTAGTPTAIPDYPGSGATTSFRNKVVSFMWAEGTWLDLTTGELNLGLVRDSILNSQNKYRNFVEEWETPAMVGVRTLRGVHTVASDGTYGAAASITLGVGSGL